MNKEAMKLALEALSNITNYEGLADARKVLREALKQEQGETVAATDIQISYEAHIQDPEDWNDLNFKECWRKGFADGFKAAEVFHKIGVAK